MASIILTRDDVKRFSLKTRPAPNTGCVEWLGNRRCAFGYGAFKLRGRQLLAHRVAWVLANGPIPNGLCVLHRCDNATCVNAAHLFLGTHLDNSIDKETKGRGNHPHRDMIPPERRARGERQWKARLTGADVAEIRSLYASGVITQRELSQRFGVHETTVHNVIKRHTWRHVA